MHRLALHIRQEPPHRLVDLFGCLTFPTLTGHTMEQKVHQVAAAHMHPLHIRHDVPVLQRRRVSLEQSGGGSGATSLTGMNQNGRAIATMSTADMGGLPGGHRGVRSRSAVTVTVGGTGSLVEQGGAITEPGSSLGV